MQKRNALIAGATGLVGNQILQQLLADDDYEKILVISRKPLDLKHPRLFQQQIDFDKIDAFKANFQVNNVFCALGTTIKTAGSQDAFFKVDYTYVVNLGKWCEANGVERFMGVSSMGASPKSRVFYSRVKGETEEAIKLLNIPQKQIFRPSLLLGKRLENRAGEKLAQLIIGKLGFLFGGSLLKYKGIKTEVVARAMINAAKMEVKGFEVYESGELQKMGAG